MFTFLGGEGYGDIENQHMHLHVSFSPSIKPDAVKKKISVFEYCSEKIKRVSRHFTGTEFQN